LDFSRDSGPFSLFGLASRLPFSAAVPSHEEPRPACAGLSVLVIDDNHYLRDVVRVILEHEGAAVLDAAGISQAQTLLECVVPDAVITDFDL
jgi:response regulator RpfG family c-di-GMP phosphodiesterase